jgi:hypothetical protein
VTTTTHVAESTLARSGGTTARDTRNARHSATSAPRDGRGLPKYIAHTSTEKVLINYIIKFINKIINYLVSSLLADSISLALVLIHQGVNILHHVGSDGGSKHSRKTDSAHNGVSVLRIINGDNWSAHIATSLEWGLWLCGHFRVFVDQKQFLAKSAILLPLERILGRNISNGFRKTANMDF